MLAVKVSEQLQKDLEYEEMVEHFWTDSKVVLAYITNESKRSHVFVTNRVQQIQERTIREQWHYVDTMSNPTDDVSRGIRMQYLVHGSRLKDGPAFLWKDVSHWPTATADSERESGCELAPDVPEIKRAVSPRLTVDDLTQAEVLIIKAVQSEEFEKEIEILT
jgi:hypothetical protein